ncbi:MAG: type II toxin-antitoxin system Phd/YefM family antitoxin [Nitrospirae bacterium]|nr:type II toxin-antitoxin system Phd/YefM family antitoxin [Nitrospirota bacterium]
MEVVLSIKSVSSTQAQNNFGQVLDDVTQNHTRYIVERRGNPKAVILSFDDFAKVLNDVKERQEMGSIIKELQPEYGVGQVVTLKTRTK